MYKAALKLYGFITIALTVQCCEIKNKELHFINFTSEEKINSEPLFFKEVVYECASKKEVRKLKKKIGAGAFRKKGNYFEVKFTKAIQNSKDMLVSICFRTIADAPNVYFQFYTNDSSFVSRMYPAEYQYIRIDTNGINTEGEIKGDIIAWYSITEGEFCQTDTVDGSWIARPDNYD